jgi:RNA polymerase sigma-70 factor (ECF subfamily)
MAMALGEQGLNWLTSAAIRHEVDVARLVEEHAALLYRVAFSVIRSAAETEDVVQETFLRALQHRETLARVESVRAWLLRVLWNLALDYKRRVLPAQLDESIATAVLSRELPADQRLSQAADLAHVLAALDRLPKLEKAVLLLTAFEDLSVAEIGMALNKSPSSVRSLTFRARTHLQERLQHAARSTSTGKSQGGRDDGR